MRQNKAKEAVSIILTASDKKELAANKGYTLQYIHMVLRGDCFNQAVIDAAKGVAVKRLTEFKFV